jgi:hypothetical protein
MGTHPLIVLADVSNDSLLELRLQIDKEMTARGLTLNVGQLGEILALHHFNNTPGLPKLIEAPKGAKNVDALSRDGDRYSIKTAQRAKKTGTVYPDVETRNKQLFEYLLIVQLTSDYQLKGIYRYSWDAFVKARAWDKRMNAWYVPISKKKLALAERVFERIASPSTSIAR